ncbi:Oxidoreductase, short-chain dehydrogenase/reductase family (plasmid) [Cupriavidus sp. U2]|uniref:SDR family oxidoreductase n=1 Tax=Cupriavidus sp. U2 TaxID=2920269 RepID=UPI00129E51E9|nr:SDR family oxidoreductase [Cupriavidus sp. U2]KAI3590321.1 Oxidoreductase, short-chain dehydrogenase/reductase family [Cupriavidus sp. U2]
MLAKGTFSNKVFFITGAGTGIGRGFALRAAELGATVVAAGRRGTLLDDVVASIHAAGGRAIPCVVDIRDPNSVQQSIDGVVEQLGTIDVLINNAAGNFVARAEDISPNGWNAVIGTVLNGSAYCALAAGKHMLGQRSGKILSISAAYAWYGGPGTAHSAAAKAGVIALSQSLAVEWGDRNVQVNCLCPGFVDTEQSRAALWPTPEGRERILSTIPAGRFETLEETVECGLFLCSPAANYITGEVLVADGGQWLNKGVFVLPAPNTRYQKV